MEVSSAIIVLTIDDKSRTEIVHKEYQIYGEGYISKMQVFEWREMFLNGHTDLTDKPYFRILSNSNSTSEDIQHIFTDSYFALCWDTDLMFF